MAFQCQPEHSALGLLDVLDDARLLFGVSLCGLLALLRRPLSMLLRCLFPLAGASWHVDGGLLAAIIVLIKVLVARHLFGWRRLITGQHNDPSEHLAEHL